MDDDGNTLNARKGMAGITPTVDEHALWHSSDKRRLTKFLKSDLSTLTLQDDDQEDITNEQKMSGLWLCGTDT